MLPVWDKMRCKMQEGFLKSYSAPPKRANVVAITIVILSAPRGRMASREGPACQENLYISVRKSFEIRGEKKLTTQGIGISL